MAKGKIGPETLEAIGEIVDEPISSAFGGKGVVLSYVTDAIGRLIGDGVEAMSSTKMMKLTAAIMRDGHSIKGDFKSKSKPKRGKEDEDEDEFDAEYVPASGNFRCLLCKTSKKGVKKPAKFYGPAGIVAHLEEEHEISPDDAVIEGWTEKHYKLYKASLKKAKEDEDEDEGEDEDEDEEKPEVFSKSELTELDTDELLEIAKEYGMERLDKKADRHRIISAILKYQREEL